MSKFSVAPTLADQIATMRDFRTRKISWLDWLVLAVIPISAGFLAGYLGFKLQGIGEILSGLALLAGFLFSLVIFIFQLRVSVTNDPRIPGNSLAPKLIDELFANVSYAVLVGLVTAATAVAAASTRSMNASGDLDPVNRYWSAVLIGLGLHLLFLLLMALKRTRRAYHELKG